MLKSCGVGGARVYVVEPESMCGGLQHFSVSPRPLGFGFGTKGFGAKGLGLRVWGQGLTIKSINFK